MTANRRAVPEDILTSIAFDRLHLFLPVVIGGLLVAMVISVPAGIPLPFGVIVGNATIILFALGLYGLLRANRIPSRWAHPMVALIWILAPMVTLSSFLATDQSTLALPLMIELSIASLQVSTLWTVISTLPVVGLGIPLALRAGGLPIYPVCLVCIWVVALIMQMFLRRSMIRAETHRLDVERTANALAHELGERRRAEDERERLRDQFIHAQRMDAVGTLAAGLAHDMNNILGGILAFAEVLHAEAKDPEVRGDLDKIRQEAGRGAALTHGLLAFSRRGQYRKQPILLHSILDDMSPLISRTLGRNITLTRTNGPPTIVNADPAQLGQVLLNLCLNGADAMNGTGTIAIATDEVIVAAHQIEGLAAGTYAKLSVTDSGTGMDAETKKRAFEPFFTTKPVGKGTGLGLAMAFGAVQAHGGAITVDSVVGRGTTMTIYLPATEVSAAAPESIAKRAVRARGIVLVVDDEPVIRAGAIRLVERLGFAGLAASDGDQAVELYKQRGDEIALVMLDMAMPRLPGPACFRELRKLGAPPVLIVSGYSQDAAVQELLAEGAVGFLEKPYTAEQLGAEIDRILGRAAG